MKQFTYTIKDELGVHARPAGLLVNLVLWGKDTDLFRLSLGALLMLASLWVCQRQPARSTE